LLRKSFWSLFFIFSKLITKLFFDLQELVLDRHLVLFGQFLVFVDDFDIKVQNRADADFSLVVVEEVVLVQLSDTLHETDEQRNLLFDAGVAHFDPLDGEGVVVECPFLIRLPRRSCRC
jgi:hypothetical protein